ncbi:tetratricopeptide repeat protein [Neogemmobacter tilapiae]|uniref:tetratricopeptide repeat protein n=1 Tax=Neogemmobacter tilapiae TaxID=875041 RepID=UPI001E4B0668|nr:hypothetical protein [Gemmobacter tilapiae]
MALQFLEAGDSYRATVLADGLLQRDPNDMQALHVKAWAAVLAGAPVQARPSAWKLYQVSRNDPAMRQEAAKLLAKVAYDRQNYGVAMWWLRRASDFATHPEELAEIADSIGNIRSQSPWRINLAFSATPSSNVNGGSSETGGSGEWFGIPIELRYDDSAQAISGIEIGGQLDVAYRVARSDKSQTMLGVRGLGSSAFLTEDAFREVMSADGDREQIKVRGRDFSYQAVEIYLAHSMRPASGNGLYVLSGRLGHSWSAGSPYTAYSQIEVTRYLRFGDKMTATLGADIRQVDYFDSDIRDLTPSLQGELAFDLPSGDGLAVGLSISDTRSNNAPNESQEAELSLNYSLGKPVGAFEISGGISANVEIFDVANLGGTRFGERKDYGVNGQLTLGLPEAQVMGFTPNFTISAGKTWSNVNRFKTVDLGVGFGWESRF